MTVHTGPLFSILTVMLVLSFKVRCWLRAASRDWRLRPNPRAGNSIVKFAVFPRAIEIVRPDLRALIVKRRRAEGNPRIRAMTSQPATLFRVAWTSWAGANRPRVTPSVALHPIGTRISGRAAW